MGWGASRVVCVLWGSREARDTTAKVGREGNSFHIYLMVHCPEVIKPSLLGAASRSASVSHRKPSLHRWNTDAQSPVQFPGGVLPFLPVRCCGQMHQLSHLFLSLFFLPVQCMKPRALHTLGKHSSWSTLYSLRQGLLKLFRLVLNSFSSPGSFELAIFLAQPPK